MFVQIKNQHLPQLLPNVGLAEQTRMFTHAKALAYSVDTTTECPSSITYKTDKIQFTLILQNYFETKRYLYT
jgi:hypothetical protein